MYRTQQRKTKQKICLNICKKSKQENLLIYFRKEGILGGFLFMEEKQYSKAHKLILSNRRTSTITGVSDVISFDITEVLLETEQGMLMIKGSDLHVNRLTLEKGEIDIEGRIDSLAYSEVTSFQKQSESLLGRLFR